MPNIFDILREEHVVMRALVQRAEENTDKDSRKLLRDDLKLLLLPHAKGEESALYPEMEKTERLRLDALEAVDEHQLIDRALETLEANLEGDDDEWKAAAQVLRETVFHHLAEEEEKTFPEAEKAFDAARKEELAEVYRHAYNARAQELK